MIGAEICFAREEAALYVVFESCWCKRRKFRRLCCLGWLTCLPERLRSSSATTDHFVVPCIDTSSRSLRSSFEVSEGRGGVGETRRRGHRGHEQVVTQ